MFWINQLVKVILLLIIQYSTGQLVLKRGIRVNYTRKINHFALFFIPMYLDSLLVHNNTMTTVLVSAVLSVVVLALYVTPIRARVPIIATMFASFDRPEDRPHTLSWLSTQVVIGWLIILAMGSWLIELKLESLLLIPVIVNGIGDGLAEPVGIRFGRHKYRVYAFFSKRKYVRSYEGSACVYLTAFVSFLFFQSSFTPIQFWIGLVTFPVIMTLAEAFSPHTWDTPLLLGLGYLSLIGLSYL